MFCAESSTVVFLLGRPTYLSADLGFIAILFSFFLRHLPSELAERNSTKTGQMVGGEYECYLKTHVRNLRYAPLEIGVKTPLFSTTSQLDGFNDLYLRSEKTRVSTLQIITSGLLHRL